MWPQNCIYFNAPCRFRRFFYANYKERGSLLARHSRARVKLSQGEGMAETVLDQILVDVRSNAAKHYPEHGELTNLRVVGHTPKNDHFIYDASMEFPDGSERIAIKIYRPGHGGGNAQRVAG